MLKETKTNPTFERKEFKAPAGGEEAYWTAAGDARGGWRVQTEQLAAAATREQKGQPFAA